MASLIDLELDELRPVNDLVEARFGKRLSPATLWRWTHKGITVGGQRIRLEAYRVSGVWCTTPPALAAFVRAQTAAALGDGPNDDDGPGERSDATSRRLANEGLL